MMSSGEASSYLGQPCLDGAVARGWYRDGEVPRLAAWCEDTNGLLQGPTLVRQGYDCQGFPVDSIGHYQGGVAHGTFSGPEGSATFVHGQLEGPCRSYFGLLTYHHGQLEGPFSWSFDKYEIASHGCHPIMANRGFVSGTFANGEAVDRLVIGRGGVRARTQPPGTIDMTDDAEPVTWHETEVSIERGVVVEVAELGDERDDISGLLGSAHRWGGRPSCPYANDNAVHRGPLR